MDKYNHYTWIIAVTVIFGGWWLLARRRMRREAIASDALCNRFGCKALPIHVVSGIRLVFDQPTWGGCLVIMGVGSSGVGAIGSTRLRRVSVTMSALTKSACPPILLRTRGSGWKRRMSAAAFPTSAVRLGDSRFQSAFETHADSLTLAETAFPPRVQALAAGIADVAGLMPAPDMTHALVDLFVEMLQTEDDKREKGDKSSDEVSVEHWGTSLVVTVRAPNRRFFSTDKSVLDQVPQFVEMVTAVVVATARLQRELDTDSCRACADPRREPPARVCKRCGARYHDACLSLLSRSASCPVWGCGDTKEQLLTLCERYARRSWFDFWKQALGLPRRESFEAPKK
jgi:hypothetical protein